jgi:hypothetical protein
VLTPLADHTLLNVAIPTTVDDSALPRTKVRQTRLRHFLNRQLWITVEGSNSCPFLSTNGPSVALPDPILTPLASHQAKRVLPKQVTLTFTLNAAVLRDAPASKHLRPSDHEQVYWKTLVFSLFCVRPFCRRKRFPKNAKCSCLVSSPLA